MIFKSIDIHHEMATATWREEAPSRRAGDSGLNLHLGENCHKIRNHNRRCASSLNIKFSLKDEPILFNTETHTLKVIQLDIHLQLQIVLLPVRRYCGWKICLVQRLVWVPQLVELHRVELEIRVRILVQVRIVIKLGTISANAAVVRIPNFHYKRTFIVQHKNAYFKVIPSS